MRRLPAVLGIAALLALTGCADDPDDVDDDAEATIAVHGTIAVEASYAVNVRDGQTTLAGPCSTKKGYDDIHGGAQVIITDADGTTLAVGEIEDKGLQPPDQDKMISTWCGFAFSVDGVPPGSPTYGVKIGNRDTRWVNAADIADGLELSLGDIPGR